MIEMKIPKEIRTYKEKLMFGLTARQCVCTVIALAINVPLYLWTSKIIGSDMAGWLVIITGLPIIMLGYFKYNGMEFEKFVKCMFNFHMYPQKRKYRTENLYRILSEMEDFDEMDNKGDI